MNNPHAAIRTPGDLIRRYPYQFERAIGNLAFHKGWFDILVQLCADIDAVLRENRHGFRWLQIKEKFGSARLYYRMDFFEKDTQDRSDEEHRIYAAISQLVHAAETQTAQRCIVCGSPGSLNRDSCYLLTLCDFHAQLRLNGVTVRPTHLELPQPALDACVHEQMRGHMDTSQPDPGVARPPKRSWRRHCDEFKSHVIAMARQGHGSVAAVALANGLNANMLRRWVRESEMADDASAATRTQAAMSPPAFVPVTLADFGDRTPAAPEPSAAPSASERVTVEIRRGTTSVSASLPMDARSAAWLRDVLA